MSKLRHKKLLFMMIDTIKFDNLFAALYRLERKLSSGLISIKLKILLNISICKR